LLEKVNFEDLKGNGKEIKNTHINIGTGEDLTIKELAEIVKNVVEFKGIIEWDNNKPDGTRQKLLNIEKLKGLNWKGKIDFYDGIIQVYKVYLNQDISLNNLKR
jgi:GDP-L-fucose synthase